ncbi:MAG: cyaD [Magnetococcales bacterium]|nr:cyaD [Magnetococcales bacterium]
MTDKQQAVRVDHAYPAPGRHPIKAARMLCSAPSWVLSGPIYLVALVTLVGLVFSFWAIREELVVVPLILERESTTTEAVKEGIVSRIHIEEGKRVGLLDKLLDVQAQSSMQNSGDKAVQAKPDDADETKTMFGSGVTETGMMTGYKSTHAGMVTMVHVKLGGNVSPGMPLVTVVKDGAGLVGRVLVQSKDIGRIKPGQVVHLKYFAYPDREYGIPEGTVSDISTKPDGRLGQESSYRVLVTLKDAAVAKPGEKPQTLETGLEGVAEIKTGDKRWIELLFSPVARFFSQHEKK